MCFIMFIYHIFTEFMLTTGISLIMIIFALFNSNYSVKE